jgi:hypothetical protein
VAELNVIVAKHGHQERSNNVLNLLYEVKTFVAHTVGYLLDQKQLKVLSVFKTHTGSMVTKPKKFEPSVAQKAYNS